MSKHFVSPAQDSVMRTIESMSVEEVVDQYGIEVSEAGHVFDPLDSRRFKSVVEWALYMDEVEEQAQYAASFHGNIRYGFDDD